MGKGSDSIAADRLEATYLCYEVGEVGRGGKLETKVAVFGAYSNKLRGTDMFVFCGMGGEKDVYLPW